MLIIRLLLLLYCCGCSGAVEQRDIKVALVVDERMKYADEVFKFASQSLSGVVGSFVNPDYQFTFIPQVDKSGTCTDGPQFQKGIASIMDFYYINNIEALFGPTCYTDLDIAARLTDEWNIVQFNFWADHPQDTIADNIIQITTKSIMNVCENIIAILRGLEWSKIVIIYCPDCYGDESDESTTSRTETIAETLQNNSIIINKIITVYRNSSVGEYQRKIFGLDAVTRVTLAFLGEQLDYYVNFQQAMRNENFTSSEYSTLIILGNYARNGIVQPWTNKPEVADLFDKVAILSNDWYNDPLVDSFADETGVPDVDLLLYMQLGESVYVYNQLVNMAPNSTHQADTLLPYLKEVEGPFGKIVFNELSHRISPFTLYTVIDGKLAKTTEQMTYMDAKDGAPHCQKAGQCLFFLPKDRSIFNIGQPNCGFKGELCDQTGTVVIIAAVMAGIFVLVGLGIAWRRMKTGETAAMPWIVPSTSLKIISMDGSQTQASMLSLQQHMENAHKLQEYMNGRQLGTLDQVYVVIDKYGMKERLSFDKNEMHILFQMKQLSHDNINPFMGLCYERNSYLMTLWTHCFRGSLHDLLFSTRDDRMTFDETFQGAFVRDILKALDYIHTSPVIYHGALTAGQCHIDSHWILKLSGYGINQMLYKWRTTNVINSVEGNFLVANNDVHYYPPEILLKLAAISFSNKEDAIEITPEEGKKADMFAFGKILYEILFKTSSAEPLEKVREIDDDTVVVHEDIARNYIENRWPKIPDDNVHNDLVSLMHSCWGLPITRPDPSLARKITDSTLKIQGSLVDQMMKNMERYTTGLEELVVQRTNQLVEAQKKADELLLELLPKSIAEDLKKGLRIDAKNYKSVSVMYSDIVGFTSLCSASQPMEVVALLSGMFDSFDRIISKHSGYKMETIGDAYCVASGIPEPNGDEHVRNIATIALLQREFLLEFEIPHRPGQYLHCRWGFNTGPVFTGVVGIRAPRYSVFGHTVTIASKMENLGTPDKIQMTFKSYQTLAHKYPEFKCNQRGSVAVPGGLGQLLTYWLEGLEPLLVSSREGYEQALREHTSGPSKSSKTTTTTNKSSDEASTFPADKPSTSTVSSVTMVSPTVADDVTVNKVKEVNVVDVNNEVKKIV